MMNPHTNLIHLPPPVLEWEPPSSRTIAGNLLSTFPIHPLCKLWKTCPRCIAGPLQPRATRASGHPFHTKPPLSTGLFSLPLQVVGNRERYTDSRALFSKCPQFHSLDLENSPPYQTLFYESHRLYFHFSCRTTGTTGFCLSLSSPFPLTVAPLRARCLGPLRLLPPPIGAGRSVLPANAWESRQTPLFSTRTAMLR